VDAVQWSAEAAEPDFGAGGGPRHPQRMIFGYTARKPYVDAAGHEWLRMCVRHCGWSMPPIDSAESCSGVCS
jgi:hypothetical protein